MVKQIEISNPDKIIYPKYKIKKIDVVEYYISVADYMLPFVKNRPLSVIRCHGGVEGKSFFKKHPAADKEVEIFSYGAEEYFYVKNAKQLAYQAQMGTVEFHTWGCNIAQLTSPDVMVFDLDPNDDVSLKMLRCAVKKLKSVLDDLSLRSYLKTSGGKGYHIVVPFKKCDDWQTFYSFSKNVACFAERKWQNDFTVNIRKSKRKGKIFIDYFRNNMGSTCIAPYSLRARPTASVSMPVPWANLNDVAPEEVTVKNYKSYLNDSWNDFFKTKGQLKNKNF